MTEDQSEYMTTTEARKQMQVSSGKMSAILRRNELIWEEDPGDRRVKLVKRADVELWIATRKRRRNPYKKLEESLSQVAAA